MISFSDKNISRKESIGVDFLYTNTKEKFKLKLVNNAGLNKKITEPIIHRPGLALAGFLEVFSHQRVQVLGNTECKFLKKMSKNERYEALNKIFERDIPCLMVTDNNPVFEELIELGDKYNTSIFSTEFPTTKSIFLVSDFLDDQFAPRISIHGSFVDVYGMGMLFVGKSGVGKSEVALDLIERGHRLVADDVVIVTKKGAGILIGSGTDIVKHFMEIRGIGIVDIQSMFGVRAIRLQKKVEVVIELELWDSETVYTRTGLDDATISICDVEIPHVKVPIVPGKNLTVIAEVIALNYLSKHQGYDAAKVFHQRLIDKIKEKSMLENERTVEYFGHDFE